MFNNLKFVAAAVILGFSLVGPAQALTVRSGTDAAGSTVNSEAAFTAWQGDVASFTLDDMTGISCTAGVCTTNLSNTFTESVGQLIETTFDGGVVSGPNLQLIEPTNPGTFIWTLPAPVDAFGFFAYDNDGGIVTIGFDDGTEHMIDLASAAGSLDNLFWGVSGLSSKITSVSITTEDVPGFSTWDRFVFGATVPVPAALPLFLSGLAFFGFVARRRARAAG